MSFRAGGMRNLYNLYISIPAYATQVTNIIMDLAFNSKPRL